MTDKTSTSNKEKILQISIELFSQKGFSGVSLREIAGAVGIKAASIYNHYQSKDEILDEITELLRAGLHQHVYPAFQTGETLDIPAFLDATIKANDDFFADPTFAQIGQIVLREQFHNETIRSMLLEELILQPRKMISEYFDRLMRSGKMRSADPTFAAKEYHAFFIYEFYENALSRQNDSPGAGQPDDTPRAGQNFEAQRERQQFERELHINTFLETWSI